MSDWRIQKKRDACGACERDFAEGEAFYSVLRAAPEGLSREDRCPACFEARDPAAAADELFFWRTRRQPQRGGGLRVDFDALEGLFLALEGKDEGRIAELRYLLSLLLLRKKRLKLVRVARKAGAEAMIVRRPRREEAFEVAVFDLDEERMELLRADLGRVFEGAGAEELGEAPGAVGDGEDELDVDGAEDAPGEAEAADVAALEPGA